MDVLAIDGKNYVKSSQIARELGYTSDYVGQLCRSGKVDAKLFGRTWYVEDSSIRGHKTTRYRSSQAVTRRELKATVPKAEKTTHIPLHSPFASGKTPRSEQEYAHFYKKASQATVAYASDGTSLIPTPSKKIFVGLADATPVAVKNNKERLVFETPELPEIRFQGKLKVVEYGDIETDTIEESAPTTQEQKNDVIHIKTFESKGKTAQNIAISSASVDDSQVMVRPKKRPTVYPAVHSSAQPSSILNSFWFSVPAAFVLALLVTGILLSLHTTMYFSEGTVATAFGSDLTVFELLFLSTSSSLF